MVHKRNLTSRLKGAIKRKCSVTKRAAPSQVPRDRISCRKLASTRQNRVKTTKGKYNEPNMNEDQNQCHYEQVGQEYYGIGTGKD